MQALLLPLRLILLALVRIQTHSAQHQAQDLGQRKPGNPLALLAHRGHLFLHPFAHDNVRGRVQGLNLRRHLLKLRHEQRPRR